MIDKSALELTDKIFFGDNDFDLDKVQSIVSDTLKDADDGELYLNQQNQNRFHLTTDE